MNANKFVAFIIAGVFLAVIASAQNDKDVTHIEDVIYGRKYGMALTMDVFQPPNPNGCAVFGMVSGAFISRHEGIRPDIYYKRFLERGYTVFAIVHSSQPKFTIHEINQDIERAIRFTRHNAARYGVDPQRFAITGASSGGYLSLAMGVFGGPGDADAPDPVDRESSAVQCVGCFSAPTDFLNWKKAGDDAVGIGPTVYLQATFGPMSYSAEDRKVLGKELSPIYHVTSNMPPTLIIHGDADPTVPIYQANIFEQRCRETGAPFKLIIKHGAGHNWPDKDPDYQTIADWFDEHLRGAKSQTGANK